IEGLAVAERKEAVLHVQVGMTHATAFDADEHLAALWLRALRDRFAERLLIGGEREAPEVCHLDILAASNACARATKPSTGISSARAVGSMSAAASNASGSGPSDFRLCRNIFRRCPNAASVTRSRSLRSQGRGLARGVSST